MRAAAIVLVLAAGCTRAEAPYTGADPCADACAHRAALGCLEAALAAQCEPVCRQQGSAGFYDPVCVARADDWAAMARCNVRCGDGGAP